MTGGAGEWGHRGVPGGAGWSDGVVRLDDDGVHVGGVGREGRGSRGGGSPREAVEGGAERGAAERPDPVHLKRIIKFY